MTPQEWQRVRPILESALELEPARRPAFLEEACADAALRREVESLIHSHEQAGTDVLNSAAIPDFAAKEEARFRLTSGKRIGVYEIVEEIAEGGMGAVYRATRADGAYRQQVAVKIVRAELGGELSAARFKNERQILASLDHPNIAKILDGGTTAEGVPYLVMELIDGRPITEYCDEHKLTIDARLKLFRTACAAVHYAHQHLVIHRDIKPGNILVTSEGVPKLLDFGIAKILVPSALGGAAATAAGLGMMTPEYASPEQLRGETLTTATDVYSLGLVLYELLAGRRAYRFVSRLPHEIAHAVLETDPEKPSTAIRRKEAPVEEGGQKVARTPEEIGGLRGDSAEKLCRRLEGDLDNIVLKAIRKELEARYTSADQLSDDIRRHLEGLPVAARKSTIAYRCRKYFMRHKVGAAAAALVFLSLAGGIVLTLREARIARANELRAERRFNDVRSLANSLIFDVHDAIQTLPGATPARKMIVEKAIVYLDSLAQEAGGDRSLQRELALAYDKVGDVQGNFAYANLGDTAGALTSYRKALAIQEPLLSHEPDNALLKRELFYTYYDIGWCYYAQSDFSSALANLRKALGYAESAAAQMQDPTAIDLWAGGYYGVAAILTERGDLSGGLENYRKAASIRQTAQGATPEQDRLIREHLAGDYGGMAHALAVQGHLDEAIEAQQKAASLAEGLLRDAPTNATLRHYLGVSYEYSGAYIERKGLLDDALSYDRKAEDVFQQLSHADPSNVLEPRWLGFARLHTGDVLFKKGQKRAALESYENALAAFNGLAARAPMNDYTGSGMAEAYGGIGKVYASLAANRGSAVAERTDQWRNARENYRKSLDIWADIQRRGGLAAEDAAQPEEARAGVAKCDAALARLSAAAR